MLTWGRIGQMILADTKFNDSKRCFQTFRFHLLSSLSGHFWFGAQRCVEETYNTPKSLCFLLEVWPMEGDHVTACLLVVNSMQA